MDKPVSISDDALTQFKTILSNNHKATGVRIGLKKAGCTGYMFFIDVVNTPETNDYRLTESEVDIFISKEIIPIIKGTVVDYQNQGLTRKFVYNNPNVKMLCGCGESFNVKKQ